MNIDLTKLLTQQIKTLSAFSIVDVEIDISPENKNSLTLICDEKHQNQVKVSFLNNNLKIATEGTLVNAIIKVIIKTSSLEEIIQKGVSDIFGTFKGNNLKINTSGVGNINLSGHVTKLDLTTSGAGAANLQKLEAQDATLKISGTSGVQVFCYNFCSVNASGIGNATIYGNPVSYKENISGLGSVKHMGKKNQPNIHQKNKNFNDNVFGNPPFGKDPFNFESQINDRYKLKKLKKYNNETEYTEHNLKTIEIEMQKKIQQIKNEKIKADEVNQENFYNIKNIINVQKPTELIQKTKENLKNKFKNLL